MTSSFLFDMHMQRLRSSITNNAVYIKKKSPSCGKMELSMKDERYINRLDELDKNKNVNLFQYRFVSTQTRRRLNVADILFTAVGSRINANTSYSQNALQ